MVDFLIKWRSHDYCRYQIQRRQVGHKRGFAQRPLANSLNFIKGSKKWEKTRMCVFDGNIPKRLPLRLISLHGWESFFVFLRFPTARVAHEISWNANPARHVWKEEQCVSAPWKRSGEWTRMTLRGSGFEVKRCVPVLDRLFLQVFHVESETSVSSQESHAGLYVERFRSVGLLKLCTYSPSSCENILLFQPLT